MNIAATANERAYAMRYGQRLRERLKGCDLGIRAFADLVGVSHSTVSRWADGLQIPNLYWASVIKRELQEAEVAAGLAPLHPRRLENYSREGMVA